MKTKIILLALALAGQNAWSQNSMLNQDPVNKEWIKNPSTAIYSLEHENKVREDLLKQNQIKYAGKADMSAVAKDIKNNDEKRRRNAIRIMGLSPGNNQISNIENLLSSDSSLAVRMECAKSLRLLKSTKSIPVLIAELKTNDQQLKLEIALTLAALGEKTESFKALGALRMIPKRNIVLDVHLGYLYLATPDAIEKLKSDLPETNPYVSVDAAIMLAELGYFKEAYPVLQSKLSDGDKFIRVCALRGLTYIGNDQSIDLIRGMLNDTEKIVKDRSELILKNCHLN